MILNRHVLLVCVFVYVSESSITNRLVCSFGSFNLLWHPSTFSTLDIIIAFSLFYIPHMHAIPKMQHTPSGRKIFIWLHSLYACMLSVTSVGRDRLSNFITQFRNNERVNGQLQSVEKKKPKCLVSTRLTMTTTTTTREQEQSDKY